MRQKKKAEDPKAGDPEPQENCIKCNQLQNGGHCSFEEPEPTPKPTTLGSLRSVLKRSASHKKSAKEKIIQKEVQVVRKQKNRVTFDESQNKYFDADYVILIHEEEYDFDDYYDEGSPYDDEDDDIYDDDTAGHNVCCSNPDCNNLITVSYPYAPGPPFLPKDRHFDFSAQYYEPPEQAKSSASANGCDYHKCDNCDQCEEVYDVNVATDYGDHVTLSPPEGYKDGGCCPHHGIQFHPQPHSSAMGGASYHEDHAPTRGDLYGGAISNGVAQEKQTSNVDTQTGNEPEEEATTEVKQRFIVETITMTTVTERRIVREADDLTLEKKGGILKGGKLWKNTSEKQPERSVNYNEVVDYKESDQEPDIEEISTSFVQNEEGNGNEDDNVMQDEKQDREDSGPSDENRDGEQDKKEKEETASPESTELTLTFKLGQHVLVANSLKPNSAVRQLFPTPRFLSPPPQEEDDETTDNDKTNPPKQFLVTAESLRLFEETKNSKILGNINEKETGQSFIAIMPPTQSSVDDARIRRTIERNTLRRSLIRYPCDFRSKRLAEKKKNENSLEERIRQLTCDIDDEEEKKDNEEDTMPSRAEPQGEEAREATEKPPRPIESSSPSDNSSSSSSAGSTYKKITDVFSRHSFPPPIREDVNCNIKSDLVATHEKTHLPDNYTHFINPKATTRNSVSTESRKQFLSTLGPLTACVGGDGKEYSLEDIDSVLKAETPKIGVQPDVIAGTPQNETPSDELALFVQQDAGRIEKLKKRYSADDKSDDEDDYGFNKRPQVKGIKPRFGTTNEIVQQIQESQTVWPYYSQGTNYQGSATQRPAILNRSPSVYSSNSSLYQCQPMRIGGGGYPELQNFHFRHPPQSPPPARHRMNSTPQPSPKPEGDGRTHPRHTEGVVRNPESVFYRRTVPNVQNPCLQMQFSPVGYSVPAASIRFAATCAPRPVVDESKVIIEPHYSTVPRPQVIRVSQGQQMIRVPVPYGTGTPVQVHLMARRCDSPQRPNSPQYLIAKGTQTAHHLPDGAPADFVKVDFEAQGKAIADELHARQKLSRSMSQEAGYQVPRPIPRPHSPICGRGVPEGAVSCPTQDSHIADPVSGNTVYYSMNV